MKFCEACGKPVKGGISIGGVTLDRQCTVDVEAEIARLREAGKTVNVLHIARRIYKENFAGGDYLLRNPPMELWNRVQHRAIDDGVSVRELVLKAIFEYLE